MNLQLRFPLVLAFASLYNFLFWQEALGLNLAIFSLLLSAVLIWMNPSALSSKGVWVSISSVCLTAFAVLYHNSLMSKWIHMSSLILLAGFVVQPQLRTVYFSVTTFLASSLAGWFQLAREVRLIRKENQSLQKLWNYLTLSLIPIAALTAFYFLYSLANPKFAQISFDFFSQLSEWFGSFSLARLLFFLSGLIVSVGFIYHSVQKDLLFREQQFSDQLKRKRKKITGTFSPIALIKEHRIAMMLFGTLNVLLLINNCIDINWIWFNFELQEGLNLKQFVHEGTYMLILSILLAMGLVLHYFRGNLNFLSKNLFLKRLVYAWIFQNAILAISVGLRNYHYIDYHGLAYKRIGVIFFLILTLYGLWTMYIKVRDQKSTFFLLRTNSWATWGIFICLSLVNWDASIARYNLTKSYPAEVDTEFLLTLSDKALPIMLEHATVFQQYGQENRLKFQTQKFIQKYESRSWKSWNWAEMEAYKKLKAK